VKQWHAVLLFVALLLAVSASLFKLGQRYPSAPAVQPTQAPSNLGVETEPTSPAISASAPPEPEPAIPMVFSRDGVNAKIIAEVERVCGANNSQVATRETSRGRWICIVVAEERRYYSLDLDFRIEHFPALQRMGFIMPSARCTT